MKAGHLEIGRLGETFAREYLRRNGYKIIEQNYRNRYGEIDLVVQKKGVLVFVEVRCKVGEQFGTPEETLNWKKLQKVKTNASSYVARSKWNKLYRVDGICIVLDEQHTIQRFKHYENI